MTDRPAPGYTPARGEAKFPDLTLHKLASPQLTADHDLARIVNSVNLKDVLRQIQTNRANFCHRTAALIVDR